MGKTLKSALALIIGVFLCFVPDAGPYEGVKTDSSKDEGVKLNLFLSYDELVEFRAERGLRNLEPHAIVLTEQGIKAYHENRKNEAIVFFKKAIELSPDFPTPYLYLAWENFTFSRKGLFTASDYMGNAWNAFLNNFWWTFQLSEIALTVLLLAFYLSALVFLIALMSSRFNLYAHDVMERKARLLYLLPSVILAFFGPVFAIIGLLLPFWIYFKRSEKAMFFAFAVLPVIMALTAPFLSSFMGASQDRILHRVVMVNSGIYGTVDRMDKNGTHRSYEDIFTHAVESKREGDFDYAIKMYRALLAQKEEARIYNNLANCYVGLNDYNTAVENYKKSLLLEETASANYNLSQIYREIFNFQDAEKYYDNAVSIDSGKVAYYNSVRGISVNRFVMDETLGGREMWPLIFKWNAYYNPSHSALRLISFTSRGFSLALLTGLMLMFYSYSKFSPDGAYRCRRCGDIYCGRCEKRISQEDVCIKCFKTLVKRTESKTKERIEKILEVQHYRDSRNKNFKILTLIFPGSGHIYYGLPISGFIISFLFAFFLFSSIVWLCIPAPLTMSHAAVFFRWVSVAGLILVYLMAVIKVFRRMPRRWR